MKRVTHADQAEAINNAQFVSDNRFFVLKELMVDMIDADERFFVSLYDATEIYNPTDGKELLGIYNEEELLACFEFDNKEEADSWVTELIALRLRDYAESQKLILKLIE